MFRGLISIRQNNLDPVLAHIVIKEREDSNELQTEVPIVLEMACVILSIGQIIFSHKKWL